MTRPQEREVFKAPPPTYDVNALYYVSDGFDWVYEPKEVYSKPDIVKPGHFNAYRNELRVGSRITCRIGKIENGIIEYEVQVIECPRSERQGDVMVSVKGRYGSFTPCRHDGGEVVDEKEKAA